MYSPGRIEGQHERDGSDHDASDRLRDDGASTSPSRSGRHDPHGHRFEDAGARRGADGTTSTVVTTPDPEPEPRHDTDGNDGDDAGRLR